ncbi:hypothetical protein B0H17DRAFT_1038867, partial [Mycena rosella]
MRPPAEVVFEASGEPPLQPFAEPLLKTLAEPLLDATAALSLTASSGIRATTNVFWRWSLVGAFTSGNH